MSIYPRSVSNLSNETKGEELHELKNQLWTKITFINAKLQNIDQATDDYRKTLDLYHKLVKSYLDIIKVERYAPGSDEDQKDVSSLLAKAKQKLLLNPQDKRAMQEFKQVLDFVEKQSLMVHKE